MCKYWRCLFIGFALGFGLAGGANIAFAQDLNAGQGDVGGFGISVNSTNQEQAPTLADTPRTVVVGIKGLISKNSAKKISQSLVQVSGDPIPAGLIVLLDSSGGDGMAAIHIGRLLRKANAHIFVTGECSSACIFILASGVVRVAPSYSVGIHRGRITMSDANAKIIKEVDISTNPSAKAALQRFESEAPVFLEEMGMSSELFPLMQSHQLKGVYRLSAPEISKMGLSGFDNAYLDKRVEVFKQRGHLFPVDRDELKKRTMRVASRCSGFEKQHPEFIRCYQETLRNPFIN